MKKIISAVLLGATLATGATTVTLLNNTPEVQAATLVNLDSCLEKHSIIDVNCWYYSNGSYVYQFKYIDSIALYNGAVQLQYPNSNEEAETIVFWKYHDVIYDRATSVTIGNKTLSKVNGMYKLEIKDTANISSVNAKFFTTNPVFWDEENHRYWHIRNTNTNDGNPVTGIGFTINQG